MTKKELHEGTVELMVTCWDPDDGEYLSSVPIDQEQFDKLNLKEDDRVQYTIDDGKHAKIIGKVHIKKTIEPIKT